MRSCRCAVGGVIIAVAVGFAPVAAPTPARADFGAPFAISRPGQDARDAAVAKNAGGSAAMVWEQLDEIGITKIYARARSAAGVLGDVQAILPSHLSAGFEPQVAVKDNGDAVVVFQAVEIERQVYARTLFASGGLGPLIPISEGGNPQTPQVAIAPDDSAVIAWYASDGTRQRVQTRDLSPAGVLGPISTLSARRRDARRPILAASASGQILFAWGAHDGTTFSVEGRVRTSAGVYTRPRTLSSPGIDASQYQVAIDGGGRGLVVWDPTENNTVEGALEARRASPTGRFGAIETFAEGSRIGGPKVGMYGKGKALFVWLDSSDNAEDGEIKARTRSATGVLGPVETVAQFKEPHVNGGDPFFLELAMNGKDKAHIVWTSLVGGDARVLTRSRSADGTYGPIQTLSSRREQHARQPQIAIDASGKGLAVWQRFDGANLRIQGAAEP